MRAAWAAFKHKRRARKARRHSRRRNPIGALAGAANPRRRRRKHAHRRHNPLYAFNARRSHRRRRNPSAITLFNPLGNVGGLLGKAVAKAKSLASKDRAVKVAAGTGGALAAVIAPARFLPQYDYGWRGVGLSAGAAIAASLIVGMVAPAAAEAVFFGGLIAAGVKAAQTYAGDTITRLSTPGAGVAGLGAYLTLDASGRGGIAPSMIAGSQQPGMGAFLETTAPMAAIGPVSSQAFAPSGRYSNAS